MLKLTPRRLRPAALRGKAGRVPMIDSLESRMLLSAGFETHGAYGFELDTSNGGHILIGDVTGDSHADIVRFNSNYSAFTVFINDGNRAFSKGGEFTANLRNTVAPILTDISGDGALDVVGIRGSSTSSELAFFLNDGSGSFNASGVSQINNADARGVISAGDLNGDGAIDIVFGQRLSTTTGNLVFISNAGVTDNGIFRGFDSAVTVGGVPRTTAITISDFDGDGRLDAAFAMYTGNRIVEIYRNTSDASPLSGTPVTLNPNANFNIEQILNLDFDGDGRDEIAFIEQEDIYLYANTSSSGNISFAPYGSTENQQTLAFLDSDGIAVGDLDGDGRDELLATRQNPRLISVVRYDADAGLLVDDYVPTNTTNYLHVAGLDGDGRLDVIAWDSSSDRMFSVLRGLGDGELAGVGGRYVDAYGGIGIEMADVNNDGVPDAVLANNNGNNNLVVILGDGSGFGETVISRVAGTNQYDMLITDVNADGNLDVVYRSGNSIHFAYGAGDGTFPTTSSMNVGVAIQTAAYADLNNDGQLDIVLAAASGSGYQILVYENSGNASFGTPSSIRQISSGTARDIHLADFNADGLLDIVVTEDKSIVVAANAGDFAFPIFGTFDPFFGDREIAHLDAADINGDGVLDIIALGVDDSTNPRQSRLGALLGNGAVTPGFSSFGFSTVVMPSDFSVNSKFRVVDVDADGRVDVLAWSLGDSDNASVVFAKGLPSVAGEPRFGSAQELSGVGSGGVALGDMDRDGDLDLVSTGNLVNSVNTDNLVTLARGYGDGTFRVTSNGLVFSGPTTNTTGNRPYTLVADFNGDGIDDYAVQSASEFSVYIRTGVGHDRVFTSSVQNQTVEAAADRMIAGDFDGDGTIDLAIILTGNRLDLWLNRGASTQAYFVPLGPVQTGTQPVDLKYADIDGDGLREIVSLHAAGASESSKIKIWKFEGSSLAQFAEHELTTDPALFELVDLNADGLLDLVVSGNYFLSISRGTGSGAFEQTPSVTFEPVDFARFEFGDFDGDGRIDLAAASETSILVYRNLTQQGQAVTFSTQRLTFSGASDSFRGLAVGDFNGNGKDTIVYHSRSNGALTLLDLVVDDSGAFVVDTAVQHDALRYSYQILLHDADSDGDLDVVGVRSLANTVWALERITNRDRGINELIKRVGPFDSGQGAIVDGAAGWSGSLAAVTANSSGKVVFFAKSNPGSPWTVQDLNDLVGLPIATGDVATWSDSVTGNYMVAALTSEGLILAEQTEPGVWSVRNLNNEVPSASLSGTLVQFTSIDGVAHLAGITANGRFVMFQQQGAGSNAWNYIDLSTDHIAAQGQTTPGVLPSTLITYVTSWNGLNIAGLDSSGNVHTVWWAPGLNLWQTSNLTKSTGGSTMDGPISVYLTSWGGINIAGLVEGEIRVTWWVPGFGGDWRDDSITENADGPRLAATTFTSYTSSWDGLNLVGIDENTGELTVYWWVPGFAKWVVSPLAEAISGDAPRPDGRISTLVTDADQFNIFGAASNGDVLRYFWQPGADWAVDNLTVQVGT
jgi:large repetitive protein